MLIVTRNNPELHPMLVRLLEGSSKPYRIKNVFLGKIYISQCPGPSRLMVFDDPLAFLYGYFFSHKKDRHLRLWALELWSQQVPVEGFRSLCRSVVFSAAEAFSYLLADSIIFPSQSRMNFVHDAYAYFSLEKKSTLVSNVPIFSLPASRLDSVLEEKLLDFCASVKRVVIYAGSLQQGRLLEEIIFDGKWGADVGLLICGSGSLDSSIKEAELNQNGICFLGRLSQPELAYVYSLADVGILSYSNEVANTRFCAPVKIWEYIHHDLKIIGNHNYGLQNDWAGYVDGFYVNASEIVSIVADIKLDKSGSTIPTFSVDDICGLI